MALATALMALTAIVVLAGLAVSPAQAGQNKDKCYETQQYQERRYKKVIPEVQEQSHQEWRWLREHKDIQVPDSQNGNSVINWLDRIGVPDAVLGGWYALPQSVIDAANFDPRSVSPTGTVNVSVYGGPSQTVNYQFIIDGPSDYTTGPSPYGGGVKVDAKTVIDVEYQAGSVVWYPSKDGWTTKYKDSPWVLVKERENERKVKVECPPETTLPPETTVPETTQPPVETTPPDTTEPETTEPEPTVPETTEPEPTTPVPPTEPPAPPAAPPATTPPALPTTGAETTVMAIVAGVLLLAGTGITRFARRG